jgi:uncharacterized membrane protein
MSNKEYKEALDAKIKELSGQINIAHIHPDLTLGQRITDKVCLFLGSWNWLLWLTVITFAWMGINLIKQIAFDPYPYMFYTMMISVWALYGNIFIQMGSNRLMEQLLWGMEQDAEVNKRSELSLLLLHQKIDILLEGKL